MATNAIRKTGRAKNAILSFFEDRLSVPKIYLDAKWANESIDVLAIDRDGVGDVYAVILCASDWLPLHPSRIEDSIEDVNTALAPIIDRLVPLPAQYKYIAVVNLERKGADPLPEIPHETLDRSYSPDGVGRIGFLAIDVAGEDDAKARLVMKPERFRARVSQLADDYIQHHAADWEIRA